MSQQIGFTRWYDRIPELSQAVRQLEHANVYHRAAICRRVIMLGEENRYDAHIHNDNGLKKLGPQKVLGLMKSKSKRRWYDLEPTTHQAFNMMYQMDDTMRYQTAVRILIALQALEKSLENPAFSERLVNQAFSEELTKTIFETPIQQLMSKVNVIKRPDATPVAAPSTAGTAAYQNPKEIRSPEAGMRLSQGASNNKHLI